ncbi:uncharacterized protein C20orf85 homolog [Octodon degus]|uniref:Uncharacterized protein C20orf85 homolog n=1 Tax=Octodon degus TaxID=10160 RepID=A0A6P3V8L9_OCTDE|nr:uncharacterized protein C20orf85 homolog [Octodon degus]
MAGKMISTEAAQRMNLVAQDEIWIVATCGLSDYLLQLGRRPHSLEGCGIERVLVLPSPPVPQTTQGFIGWRSAVPGLNKCLEHDSAIRSCKGAYARGLGWPKQGIH